MGTLSAVSVDGNMPDRLNFHQEEELWVSGQAQSRRETG